jgi:predicted ribosomally synthesized peptide with SipW-like signal peptide
MRQRRRVRNRRIKAILAGGLVFGIGSAATVAAWTDSENAEGSFTAGQFDIMLSVDGSDWTSNRTMTFNAGSMFPGAKVYAPVFVKTSDETTIGGNVKVSGGGTDESNALGDALTYRAVTQSIDPDVDYECNSDSFTGAGASVFSGANLKEAVESPSEQTLKPSGDNIQAYCFEVTLSQEADNAAQGQTATHTWTWHAESVAE